MTTDTEQTTRIHITRDQQKTGRRDVLEVWTGLFAAALVGFLAHLAIDAATTLQPDRVFLGLIRSATVGALVVAFISYSTPRAVDDLVGRIDGAIVRNRSAIEANTHRIDDLRDVVFDGSTKTMIVVQDGARKNQELRHAIVEASHRVNGELVEYRRELADVAALLSWVCIEMARQSGPDRTGLDPRTLAAIERLNKRLQS